MAEVTSYTAEHIEAMMAELQQVLEEQSATSARIAELRSEVLAAVEELNNLNQNTIPGINASVGGATQATSDVVENQIPNLEQMVEDQRLLTIQSIPKIFRQDEPPTNEDDPERELQPEDRWFDTNDSDKEYHWDGTAWIPANISIADFSLTVRKFLTNTHEIY